MNESLTPPNPVTAVTVVLIEGDAPAREAFLSALLPQKDIFVHGMYESLAEARERMGSSIPNLVVIGDSVPREDALKFTRQLRERRPPVTVVFRSGETRVKSVIDALSAGASGYITRTATSEEIVNCVRKSANEGSWLPRALCIDLIREFDPDFEFPNQGPTP